MKIKLFSLLLLCFMMFSVCACTIRIGHTITIAQNGSAHYTIISELSNENINLSIQKLKTFIDGVSGADIAVNSNDGKKITLTVDETLSEGHYEAYAEKNENIIIKANDTRVLYFAVTEFIDILRPTSSNSSVVFDADVLIDKIFVPLDNSSLIPSYKKAEDVLLVKPYFRGKETTPDWVSELTIVEIRLETATEQGTFEAAVSVLDRLAGVGVNGIWLCPIYDGEYGNKGPQSLNPKLSGTTDYEQGWKKAATFVEEAHKRNIRVFLDIISWGVWLDSPLVTEHPDWFSGIGSWGGYDYNWKNPEMKEWFITEAVSIIERTNADGFRCDLEPAQTEDYDVYKEIRLRLYSKGYKIAIFSEGTGARDGTYDFEQIGIKVNVGNYLETPQTPYLHKNQMQAIKLLQCINASEFNSRFNTYCLSMHDYTNTPTRKNRLLMGFSAICMPNIPLWFLGEEYGIEATGTLYYTAKQNLSLLENAENYSFYNDVKKYLSMKYTYPDIFCSYSEKFNANKVCAVKAEGCGTIDAFARFADGRGVLMIPNNDSSNILGRISVEIPYTNMKIITPYVRITNLMKNEVIYEGLSTDLTSITAYVEYNNFGLYLVEGLETLKS